MKFPIQVDTGTVLEPTRSIFSCINNCEKGKLFILRTTYLTTGYDSWRTEVARGLGKKSEREWVPSTFWTRQQ